MIPKSRKTFIRVCALCDNTFETDQELRHICKFCTTALNLANIRPTSMDIGDPNGFVDAIK